jgi:methyltransferase family protein
MPQVPNRSKAQPVGEDVGDPNQPGWPPGHFHSPIPLISEVQRREADIFGAPAVLPGIDLAGSDQLALLGELTKYYADLPFGDERIDGLTYSFNNEAFSYADAISLYSIIRNFRPKRIVEVGSGYSSAVIIDTNRLFFDGAIDCTFVEPYPDRLLSLVPESGLQGWRLLRNKVQEVELAIFEELDAGDILFVDSTHVSKVGSDVNWLIFQVLPTLKAGVLIHFHDVFYPFEYPREWIYKGWAWNEAYLLRAFLAYNREFRIVYFLDYLARFHRDRLAAAMPLCLKNTGGGLWIRRRKSSLQPGVRS